MVDGKDPKRGKRKTLKEVEAHVLPDRRYNGVSVAYRRL